jgi:hypothetical protein
MAAAEEMAIGRQRAARQLEWRRLGRAMRDGGLGDGNWEGGGRRGSLERRRLRRRRFGKSMTGKVGHYNPFRGFFSHQAHILQVIFDRFLLYNYVDSVRIFKRILIKTNWPNAAIIRLSLIIESVQYVHCIHWYILYSDISDRH